MNWRGLLGMYAQVTAVAVLIWFWAAAETRGHDSASFRLILVPASPTDEVVKPGELAVNVEMEGSRLALQKAHTLASQMPLTLTVGTELPAQVGTHQADLVTVLEKHEPLTDTGVRVVSVDPALCEIEIDSLVPVTAPINPDLPNIETEGQVEVNPPQAVVHLPSRVMREHAGEDLELEAHPLQARLDNLEPGVRHTVDAKLRLPAKYAGDGPVMIDPPTATIQFTVKSRIKELTLPTVRVQIAGPPEDNDEYAIAIEDNTLADVTIKAPAEVIRQVERNQAVVVALLHLSQKEKEQGIQRKPVTCFIVLPREDNATFAATLVQAEVGGSSQPPQVRLKITPRATSK